MDSAFTIRDFVDIFSKKMFFLPVRWDGKNYSETLKTIYDDYCFNFKSLFLYNDSIQNLYSDVKNICSKILTALKEYLDGKPSQAFAVFDELFREVLMANQFSIYEKLVDPNILENKTETNRSRLFRVRKVDDNKIYKRKDVFHTPFDLRNKIATTRYSIAGYPSLYLSSSLELCLEELDYDMNPGRYICSRFELSSESSAKIVELGIKPIDFFPVASPFKTKRQKLIEDIHLDDSKTLRNYYLWFPLIIACSFVRINRSDPFAIEYVIPQLLMQSVRSYSSNKEGIMGVRFFSCSSEYSSELGFNYVFPTNYDFKQQKFCRTLSKAFLLTEPVFLNESENIQCCETDLSNKNTECIPTEDIL